MNYVTEIFSRASLQNVRNFLLHGTADFEESGETYKKRLEAVGMTVFKMVEEKFPNFEERDTIAAHLHHYASVIENVYMEIGMQCGAVIAMQLLENPRKEYPPSAGITGNKFKRSPFGGASRPDGRVCWS